MFFIIGELIVAIFSAFAVGYTVGTGTRFQPIDYWNILLGVTAIAAVIIAII